MGSKLLELPKLPSITAPGSDAGSWSGDLLVIGLFDNAFDAEKKAFTSEADLGGLAPALVETLADILSDDEFKLKPGSSKSMRCVGNGGAKHVAVVGLGKQEGAPSNKLRWGKSPLHLLGSTLRSLSKQHKCKTAAVLLPPPSASPAAVEEFALGAFLGGYEATRFKSSPPASPASLDHVHVLGAQGDIAAAVGRAHALADGHLVARQLVEAPPNVASPVHLADYAKWIQAAHPDRFTLSVRGRAECEAMGMGCYLGVAEAADAEPQFIHLKYTPAGAGSSSDAGKKRKVIALVGKGVTFDSGGYNIKAGAGSMIEMMKFDMGGAGAVLGAAHAVGGLQPENVEVHFITAACENMINGHGLRPGDIVTSSNGKTVEVNNTDAEGRLTLCDAINYAVGEHVGADTVVDIATLTGACLVALGQGIGGLYSNSDALADELRGGGAKHGEKLWRMPLEDAYFEHLKSPIADMKNTGIRWGGSITAALFLKEFVPEKVDWAHIDMAGPVWDEKNGGATGFGVATLSQFVVDMANIKDN